MKSNEQFKKILRTSFKLLLILAQTVIFAYVWISQYNNIITAPFFRKGNWFFYLVYIIILSLFLYAFDALKYGVYRRTNLIIAQILATLATLFIIYLQIVLLSAEFITVFPLIFAFLADILVILIITFGGDWIMKMLFPARKTLIIYDQYSPEVFIEKIKTRKDKLAISE